jgi:ribose transport system substrate-binding protein
MRLAKSRSLWAFVAAALLASGCSSASTTPTAPAPTPTAQVSAPATAVASAPAASPSAAPAVGWQPDPSCQSTDPIVQQAIQLTEKRTIPPTQWFGPTSGPKLKPGVKIVEIADNVKEQMALTWGQDVVSIAKKIGWSATMIDGQGTAQGWISAFTQAIALKPDVIITSADIPTLASYVKQAHDAGIGVIGLHGTALAGPDPSLYEYTNITSDPYEIGAAQADYAIADSCGTAKMIIEYDSSFQIATIKAQAMLAEIQKCKGCEVLAYVNSPLSQLSTLQPQLCSTWASKYGKGWYAGTVYDGVWDFCVPALQSAGFGPSDVHLMGSDGTLQAYQRMRAGQFQVATVPEPAELQAYAAINDANNYVQGLPPSYGTASGQWTEPVYVAFSETGHGSNIALAGGDKNQFFPTNDYASRFMQLWGVTQ